MRTKRWGRSLAAVRDPRHRRAHASDLLARLDEKTGGMSAPSTISVRAGADLSLQPGLHEWFQDGHDQRLPPLSLLIGLAQQAICRHPRKCIAWIGQRCWPYPHALVQREPLRQRHADRRLLKQSVFVRAVSKSERIWAAELALRCSGIALVATDGRGLEMAESRRLQLAAHHSGAVGLLVRPARELNELSAARTRWRVSSAPSATHHQSWTVQLLRCKGLQPINEGTRAWLVQRDHATGQFQDWQAGHGHMAAETVHRHHQATRSEIA